MPNIDALDTSDAGTLSSDAFAAGLSKGSSLEESGRMAAKAASLSCTRQGATGGVPRIAELDERPPL